MIIAPFPIRLVGDNALPFANDTDLNTSQIPQFVRASDIEIDLGLFSNGNFLTGLGTSGAGGIASITAYLYASENDTNSPMLAATTSSFDTALTSTEWNDDTTPYYFCNFTFTATQTGAIALNGQPGANCWLRIMVTTTDTPAKTFPVFEGSLIVKDGPIGSTALPALPASKVVVIGGVNYNAFLNQTDGKYYALVCQTVGGVVVFGPSDVGY
jgi:hypothetical protein